MVRRKDAPPNRLNNFLFSLGRGCALTGLVRCAADRAGAVEPRLMEVSRSPRLSSVDRVRKIIIPAALPRIFLAFRLAAGIALIVAVTPRSHQSDRAWRRNHDRAASAEARPYPRTPLPRSGLVQYLFSDVLAVRPIAIATVC
jgi:hypothetical protein